MADVEIGVSECTLPASGGGGTVKVQIDTLGITDKPLTTPAVRRPAGSEPVRFAFSKSIRVAKNGQAWSALLRAIEWGKKQRDRADITFSLVDGGSGKVLGSGAVSLLGLLGAASDPGPQPLNMLDGHGKTAGTLVVTVKALAAVNLVSAEQVEPNVRAAFDAFDTDGSGDIDQSELRNALSRLGMEVDDAGAAQVLRRYTEQGKKTLSLLEFDALAKDLSKFRESAGGGTAAPTGAGVGIPRPSRGGSAAASVQIEPSVRAAFDAFDTDGSGDIDASELRNALKSMGMETDGQQAAAVLRRYDSVSGGTILLHDFAKLVSDLQQYQGVSTPAASRQASSASSAHVEPKVRAAFDAFDTDGSGDIDARELRSALKQLGMETDGAQAAAVLRRYDSGAGTLGLAEFAKLVTDLQQYQGGGGGGGGAVPIRRTQSAKAAIDPQVRSAFDKFDTDKSGDIDARELTAALKVLGMQTSEAQARQILSKYDTNLADGRLDLFEFAQLIADLRQYQGGGGGGGGGGAVDPKVRAAFVHFDTNRSGDIDVRELRAALKHMGIDATGDEAAQVLRRYDTNPDGKLDLGEFAALVADILQHQGGGGGGRGVDAKTRAAFELFDKNNSGDIDVSELIGALSHLGVQTDGPAAAQILRRYDTDRSGGITLNEFDVLVKDLIAFQSGGVPEEVRAAFQRFDRDRSGGIDAKELRPALRELGIDADGQQVLALLGQYDTDSNAALDLHEFAKLVKDVRDFQSGNARDAIATQLRRRDIAEMLAAAKPALDEIFTAFAMLHADAASAAPGAAGERDLSFEQLQALLHGFGALPSRLAVADVRAAVREMQPSSTASTALLPLKRDDFGEALLRLAHYMAARSPAIRTAEAAQRLSEMLKLLRVNDLSAMRGAMRGHLLMEACTVGDTALVTTLLSEGAAIDAKDVEGWTPLHKAAAYGHEGAAAALLNAGASLADKTNDGWSAVHWCAEYGHAHVLHVLLKAGAPCADLTPSTQWTPLHRASIDGHADVVKALLAAGSPTSSCDRDGDTPLHDAARNGHLPVVQALVTGGATLDLPNHFGKTPIDLAREGNRANVADYLNAKMRKLDKGASQRW